MRVKWRAEIKPIYFSTDRGYLPRVFVTVLSPNLGEPSHLSLSVLCVLPPLAKHDMSSCLIGGADPVLQGHLSCATLTLKICAD